MSMSFLERTEMLLGKAAIEKINNSKVAVFGLGGVGSYTVEALARVGIGNIILIDSDTVSLSNINRQLIADTTTVGMNKTDAAKERVKRINPDINVEIINRFIMDGDDLGFLSDCDFVVDAIDTVSTKIYLVCECERLSIPIISSMGTGNKNNPTLFEVSDIYKTSVCPLCRVMRRELKNRNIKKLKVVYSKEEPMTPKNKVNDGHRIVPGSLSFVPGVAGLILAREAVFEIIRGSSND